MDKRKAIVKSTIQCIAGIFMLVILTYSKAMAEPMEPAPSKDEVNKLIIQIAKSKQDQNLVDNLLKIALYYMYEENKECGTYIDRALSLSEKLSYAGGLGKSMCLKAAFLNNIMSDTVSANRMIEKAILWSRSHENLDLEAYAYYARSNWLNWVGYKGTPVTEGYITQSRELYKKSGNKINEAYMLKCLADFHYGQNKFGEALKELFEAIDIYKEAGFTKLHYTYDLIGSVYNVMGNFDESLKYGLLTIKSAEQAKDTADISLFYVRVGSVFMTLKQPADALPYYLYVLDNSHKNVHNFYFHRAAAASVSNIYVLTGKPEEALKVYQKAMTVHTPKQGTIEYRMDEYYLGNVYYSLKRYTEAEQLYLHALQDKNEDAFTERFRLTATLRLGNFYIAQGKFEKARLYINELLAMKIHKSPLDIAGINLQQYKVDSAFGNYLSAIKHFQIYKSINDSLFNDKKSKQIASINIQYETEKKEQRIGTLTAENRAQKALVEKRFFERNVFTAGAIMLLLLLFLTFNRYRIKQKANRQLQEQQEIINKKNDALNCLLQEKEGLIQSKDKLIIEKEWLIKEVHHRVKNNLQMISTLLYSQASYLRDSVAIAAINESQQRIHAISLIHKKLYQSQNIQMVNMQSYVHELVDYLKESFDSAQEIEFNLEVDSFEIGLAKAIPLGLILNEAVTNSMKYAFCKDSRKIISIQLQRRENRSILLQIKDNGKGMPADINPNESDTLGINLMHGLSNQINSVFSIRNENGTVISLELEEKDEPLSEPAIY